MPRTAAPAAAAAFALLASLAMAALVVASQAQLESSSVTHRTLYQRPNNHRQHHHHQRRLRANATSSPSAVTRVVILSDTHMAGPEYALGGENGIIDNDSISKTQMRMYYTIQTLNAINKLSPKPRLAVFGGDVVHNGLDILHKFGVNASGVQQLYAMPVSGYSVASALMDTLNIPKLYSWGNHDNFMSCGDASQTLSKDLLADIYMRYFQALPYDVRDLGAWRVVSLNSMWGETWDPLSARCWDRLSSYGQQQLAWLDQLLSDNKHTLMVFHFPPVTAIMNETGIDDPKIRDLATVLGRHRNVRLMLSGHFHKGTYWGDMGLGIPALTVPGVRYNSQNFNVLDLFDNGTFVMHDSVAKNRNYSRCSNWYDFNAANPNGAFAGTQPALDAGNCGTPRADPAVEAAFNLSEIHNTTQVPSQDVFNPEGACRFIFAKKYFAACTAGASASCCKVVSDAFRPSSSASFANCLCEPDMWAQAGHYFQQHGQNASSVLLSCVQDFQQSILFTGGPLSWCPTTSHKSTLPQ